HVEVGPHHGSDHRGRPRPTTLAVHSSSPETAQDMSDGPGPQVRVVGEPSPPVGVLRTARDAMAAQWPRLTDQQINWLERNWAAPWTDAVLDLWSRRRNGPPMTTPMPDPENPN